MHSSLDAFSFHEIPIQYITPEIVSTRHKEVRKFLIRTCGGEHVDRYILSVNVNLPNKAWSQSIGKFSESDSKTMSNNKRVESEFPSILGVPLTNGVQRPCVLTMVQTSRAVKDKGYSLQLACKRIQF